MDDAGAVVGEGFQGALSFGDVKCFADEYEFTNKEAGAVLSPRGLSAFTASCDRGGPEGGHWVFANPALLLASPMLLVVASRKRGFNWPCGAVHCCRRSNWYSRFS